MGDQQKIQSIEEFLMKWITRGVLIRQRCDSDIAIILYKDKTHDKQEKLENLAENDELEIRLLPRVKAIKRDGKLYKIQLRLLLEKLTLEQVTLLKKELDLIRDLHDLNIKEGLALMIQIFIMVSDYYRITNKMTPIYPVNEIDKIELLSYELLKRDDESGTELYSNKILITLDEILELWCKSELSYSQSIFDVMLAHLKNKGKINYLTIPPTWRSFLSIKDIDKKQNSIINGLGSLEAPGHKLYIRSTKKSPKYLKAIEIAKEQIRKHKKDEKPEEGFIEGIEYIENKKELNEYIIKKEQLSWKIIYEGKEYTLPAKRKAIEIIIYIIENDKGEGIHVVDIYNEINKGKKIRKRNENEFYSDYTNDQWEIEERMKVIDPKKKVIKTTKEEAKTLAKRLNTLSERRKKAEENENEKILEEIEKELKQIKQKLMGEKDKDGNILEWSPQQKKCYDSIKRCYDRFLEEINTKEYENLYLHLKSSITIGAYCFYKPDRNIPWNK